MFGKLFFVFGRKCGVHFSVAKSYKNCTSELYFSFMLFKCSYNNTVLINSVCVYFVPFK